MKFALAVVVLVLAVSANSSIIPLAYSAPWSVSPFAASPLTVSPWGVAPVAYTARSAPLARFAYATAPAAVHIAPVHIAPVHISAPALVPVAAEGTYTAANRGAVHVAPLPGHLQSAASINLEAAPGTL